LRRIWLAIVLCVALVDAAAAQVVGRIVGPGATRIQVAVSPLAETGGGGLGARFAEVVARNLSLSGYFQILDSKAYIEGPTPIDLDQINFANWNVLGARALVKGAVTSSAGGIEIEARLFDVGQRNQIGGNRYRGTANEVPRIARRFADSVIRMITGEEGPFDSRIVFASRRAGRSKEIWVMSVDGFETTQLTSNRTINLAPSWSPNAGSILFTSYQDGNPSLYRLDLSSRSERRLSSIRGLNLGGRWSPDSQHLALSLERGGNADLYLLDANGQIARQLTKHPEIDVSPTWSPDGKRLAFVSSRVGGPQIYVMNADGSGERRLTFQGSYNTSPSWSPKGDFIAYVSRDRGFNIFTIHVESGQVRQVTSGQGNNEDPSFSPDGRYLVFSSTRLGKPVLFLSDATGAHQVQLTKSGGDDSSPAWSPRLP
jgi:TolB protein